MSWLLQEEQYRLQVVQVTTILRTLLLTGVTSTGLQYHRCILGNWLLGKTSGFFQNSLKGLYRGAVWGLLRGIRGVQTTERLGFRVVNFACALVTTCSTADMVVPKNWELQFRPPKYMLILIMGILKMVPSIFGNRHIA